MSVGYIGEADQEHKINVRFQKIQEFVSAFIPWYEDLGKRASFLPVPINSVGIHLYSHSTGGISLHRDESKYVNLIAIVNLKGEAEFYLSKKRENPAQTLKTSQGSMILMRAPRNDSEKGMLPYHGVGNVIEERYSLILRSRIITST